MDVRVKTAPIIEPIELDEAKDHIEIDETDLAHDDKIEKMIKAATAAALTYTRRSFIEQTLELYLEEWPDSVFIEVPRPPLISVTSIEYVANFGDSPEYLVLAASNYQVNLSTDIPFIRLTPTGSFPTIDGDHAEPIRITYVAGYGKEPDTVPEGIRHAIKVITADYFQSRESDALAFSAATIDTIKMSRLLWPYRVAK